MEKTVPLWFKGYQNKYEEKDPFFVPTASMELANELETQYDNICEELKVLWETKSPEAETMYGNYSAHEEGQIPANSWKKLVFMVWGIRNKRVCDKFPLVTSVFEKYTAVTSCYVTR